MYEDPSFAVTARRDLLRAEHRRLVTLVQPRREPLRSRLPIACRACVRLRRLA